MQYRVVVDIIFVYLLRIESFTSLILIMSHLYFILMKISLSLSLVNVTIKVNIYKHSRKISKTNIYKI